MRVIRTDNYDRETSPEAFMGTYETLWGPVVDNLSHEEALRLADDLNDRAPRHGPYYYRVVPDGYVLRKGFEP